MGLPASVARIRRIIPPVGGGAPTPPAAAGPAPGAGVGASTISSTDVMDTHSTGESVACPAHETLSGRTDKNAVVFCGNLAHSNTMYFPLTCLFF